MNHTFQKIIAMNTARESVDVSYFAHRYGIYYLVWNVCVKKTRLACLSVKASRVRCKMLTNTTAANTQRKSLYFHHKILVEINYYFIVPLTYVT